MTDLEDLWDAYPTGPAPVGAILAAAEGAGRERRRRVLVRPLLTAAAVTALAGAYLAGTLTGDSGPGGPGGSGPGGPSAGPGGVDRLPRHVAFQADLEPATSCDDLRASYVRRGLEVVGPWGWGGGGPIAYGTEGDLLSRNLSTPATSDQAAGGAAKAPRTDRQTSSETGTNVQEAGVDEPDTVKTDGSVLVVARHDRLDVYDVTGSSTAKVSTVDLPGVDGPEILLAGDTVVALGRDAGTPAEAPGTRVLTVSIADPAAPKVVDDVRYDAREVSARQHGNTVRLVVANGLPELDFVEPTGKRSEKEALAHNRKAVEDSTLADWLPTVAVGDAKPTQLLDCRDVAVPPDVLALGTTSVVGFDAADAGGLDAIGLAGLTDIAYESADHLYLAGAGSESWGCIDWCGDLVTGTSRVFPGGLNDGSSYLFDFALDGTRATHVASGEVEGAIRDRWSLDEAGGVLRVAVGPTSETGNFSSVVTFERQGQELVERGRLDGLGRNEEIESVRWFDDLALVVTFRRTDPLYAVDLTDTSAPRLLGALKIPGFSSYLHPLGRVRLIGVGEGPGPDGWGAQVGLFDVRDTSRVSRLDVLGYGRDTSPLAGTAPRAFTWLPDQRTVLTVVEKWGSRRVGYLSVLKLADNKLHERRIKVEYGDDVDLVRTVPLPDGRVVLVTGDEAQFLEL